GAFWRGAAADHQLLPGWPRRWPASRRTCVVASAGTFDGRFHVTPILTVDRLTKRFFGVAALSEVSFSVSAGELLSIIGPNGSGKTTLFNIITGFLRPEDGRVTYRGSDITLWPPHAIARQGLVRTFQDVRLFAGLSALDNLLLAAQQHQEEDLLGRFVWSPK